MTGALPPTAALHGLEMTRVLLASFVILLLLPALPALAQLKKGDKAADFGQRDLFADPALKIEHWVSDFVGPEAGKKAKRALLISFCASYCTPCWKELNAILSLKEKYGDRGFEAWAVLVDQDEQGRAEGKKKLEPAKGKMICTGIGAPNMRDTYMGRGRWKMPALFLIDSKGEIVAVVHGLDKHGLATLEKQIVALLRTD